MRAISNNKGCDRGVVECRLRASLGAHQGRPLAFPRRRVRRGRRNTDADGPAVGLNLQRIRTHAADRQPVSHDYSKQS